MMDLPLDRMLLVALPLAALVGFGAAWLICRTKSAREISRKEAEHLAQLGLAEERLAHAAQTRQQLGEEKTALADQLADIDRQRQQLLTQTAELKVRIETQQARCESLEAVGKENERDLSTLRQQNTELREKVSHVETKLEEQQKQSEEKLKLLADAKARLTEEFKNLANDILEDKSKKFTAQNRENLESVLKPLSGQIKDFQKRVEDAYEKESRDRFSLAKEIQNLQALNTRISEDAVNLTNALKGESKTQGTWGELKLERVLEASGLVKGREYDVQVSMKNEQGERLQPDVVVHLPENKDIVIDSKVTLTAYHRYMSEEGEEEREKAATEHMKSLQTHIRQLSGKDYQDIPELRTLDFVLMFLPVEEAFNLAVQKDPELFSKAFERNIILVGPSTLLATLKTIQHIWRNEYQTQNAQEIARQAGGLYEKFANFINDLEEVGARLTKAQDAYDKAHNKLASGRGNLVNRAETLKKLGAKTSKSLPKTLVDSSAQNLQVVEVKDKV